MSSMYALDKGREGLWGTVRSDSVRAETVSLPSAPPEDYLGRRCGSREGFPEIMKHD